MEKNQQRIWKIGLTYAIVVLVCATALFASVVVYNRYFRLCVDPPHPPSPDATADIQAIAGGYRVTVLVEPRENTTLLDAYVSSVSIADSEGERVDDPHLGGLEGGSVLFVDNDGDGRISHLDHFDITGDITKENFEFRMSWSAKVHSPEIESMGHKSHTKQIGAYVRVSFEYDNIVMVSPGRQEELAKQDLLIKKVIDTSPSDSASFDVVVGNHGDIGVSGPITVEMRVDGVAVDTVVVESLDPWENKTLGFEWTEHGEGHEYEFVIDPDKVYIEYDRSNNKYTVSVL